jgi:hypothetical protein
MTNNTDIDQKPEAFNRRILASCHINFLFGTGVNGGLSPLMKGLAKTIELAKQLCKEENVAETENVEECFRLLKNGDSVKKLQSAFIQEVKDSIVMDKLADQPAFKDLVRMLAATKKIVTNSENRNISMKQVNIFTLNYDGIVEAAAGMADFYFHTITPQNFLGLFTKTLLNNPRGIGLLP